MSMPPDQPATSPLLPNGAAGGSRLSGGVALMLLRLAHSRWLMAGFAVAVLSLLGGTVWLVTSKRSIPPDVQFQQALALLDQRENFEARELARELALQLLAQGYRDPAFPGGVVFILGQIAFRDAQDLDAPVDQEQYEAAVRLLRDAEAQALDTDHRPEWAYALGLSLHQIGAPTEAKPLLEEAMRTFTVGRADAIKSLIEIHLDLQTPDALSRALELSDRLVAQNDLAPSDRDEIWLQRAEVLMSLSRFGEAEAALAHLSTRAATEHGTIVLRARSLMSRGADREALDLLQPVADNQGLDQSFSRTALYLSGWCAEKLGDHELAISAFERTLHRYHGSQEAVAAQARAARLLRQAGRHEEALNAYRIALGSVDRAEDFRNRWLGLPEFRQMVLDAWNDWVRDKHFEEAVELARMLSPLLPAAQASELAARAHQLRAEHLEQEIAAVSFSERTARQQRVWDAWRQSGDAYARYAAAVKTTAAYTGALWTSADHYRRGHDFNHALEQLTSFINTRPQSLLPLALLRRGQVLMDLDRSDDALDHFRKVIREFPTDPAAVEARYEQGRCHLERNELDEAEQAWRDLLASEQLTPDAVEWRMSLFGLARLLYHTAVVAMSKVGADQEPNAGPTASERFDTALNRFDEATLRLEEYLKRYPDSPEAAEARYLLAKSLQQSGSAPARQQTAATEAVRQTLQRSSDGLLRRARQEFQTLRSQLQQAAENDRLDTLHRQLLQNCDYEIANTEYALENYDAALAAYNAAATRNPQDPRAFFARLQAANCYERLGKPLEARSMLEQARLILQQLPDQDFTASDTNFSRAEWERWLNWADRPRPAPAAQ